MNYRPLEFITLVEKLDSNFDWDCVLIGFGGGGVEPNNGANVLRSSGDLHLWNPDQKTPATPWEAEIDKLLEQGTAEMDVQKRVPYYWRIQEIIHDQLPIIETVRQLRFTAYRNTLKNFRPPYGASIGASTSSSRLTNSRGQNRWRAFSSNASST